jgi:hypothetical protein
MEGRGGGGLTPSEKYEISVSVLSGQAAQREAVERFKFDCGACVQGLQRRRPWVRVAKCSRRRSSNSTVKHLGTSTVLVTFAHPRSG